LAGGESHQANGRTAYSVNFGKLTDRVTNINAMPAVWAVALDEPAGLALFPSKQSFEAASAAHAGQADNLDTGATRDTFDRLLSETGGDPFVLAANLSPQFQRSISSQLPFPSPKAGVFSFGDEVAVELIGSKKSLDGIETLVEQYRAKMLDRTQASYAQRETFAIPKAAGIVASYHMLQSYNEAIESTRVDDAIAYSMAIPDDQVYVTLIGIGAAQKIMLRLSPGRRRRKEMSREPAMVGCARMERARHLAERPNLLRL
jgi:hypothetical protein